MQMDAKLFPAQADEPANQQLSYSPTLKDKALKVLVDYRTWSGRGWQKIRDEIVQVTCAPETTNAPLLNRQDLEAWASRRSILGDEKFFWVLKFLTHPDIIKRDEFATARDLSKFGSIARVGETFSEFYCDRVSDTDAIPVRHRDGVIYWPNSYLPGLYTASDNSGIWWVALRPVVNQRFLIAHVLKTPRPLSSAMRDWNLMRWSGFCTLGSVVRLHLRGVLDAFPRYMEIKVHINLLTITAYAITLISDAVFEKLRVEGSEGEISDETNQSVFRLTLKLVRSEDQVVNDIIDRIEWNIL